MTETICRIVVYGRVQGVGYRAFVADEAGVAGVEGWVRNRRDGTVEAVMSGSRRALESMIAACQRGPWGARVDSIEESQAGADELTQRRAGEPFSVLPTA